MSIERMSKLQRWIMRTLYVNKTRWTGVNELTFKFGKIILKRGRVRPSISLFEKFLGSPTQAGASLVKTAQNRVGATISRTIKNLREKGYVKRWRYKKSGYTKGVMLTKKGLKKAKSLNVKK